MLNLIQYQRKLKLLLFKKKMKIML